jgi:hypothetical protein
MFFSFSENWWNLTNPTYASVLPIPQRYYVPGRIREIFKPRLEASGLWNLPAMEPKVKSPFAQKKEETKNEKDTYGRAFKREKARILIISVHFEPRLFTDLGERSFCSGYVRQTLGVQRLLLP